MKVLHVLDSLNRGGTETLLLDVCRNAAAAELELTLVATGGGDLEAEFAASGVEFVRLRRRAPFDPGVVMRLRAMIKERVVQVIHCHQAVEALHAYAATVGTSACRVMSFHLAGGDRKNRLALRFLASRTDANVAVSRALRDELNDEGDVDASGFHVLYNGIDANRLCEIAGDDAARVRAQLGIADDELLFGMIGNFYDSRRKDQMTVCQALPAFFDAAPRSQFLFVGGSVGAEGAAYKARCVAYCRERGIADRTHFLGARGDAAQVLAALDGFVLSSRLESFGIALVEALMTGVPSIISDIAPLVEVAGDGDHAHVFHVGDATDLATKMTEVAHTDAAVRQTQARATRDWARAEYGIATHLRRSRELYESLTNERREAGGRA